jgi:hypothetical protein
MGTEGVYGEVGNGGDEKSGENASGVASRFLLT